MGSHRASGWHRISGLPQVGWNLLRGDCQWQRNRSGPGRPRHGPRHRRLGPRHPTLSCRYRAGAWSADIADQLTPAADCRSDTGDLLPSELAGLVDGVLWPFLGPISLGHNRSTTISRIPDIQNQHETASGEGFGEVAGNQVVVMHLSELRAFVRASLLGNLTSCPETASR